MVFSKNDILLSRHCDVQLNIKPVQSQIKKNTEYVTRNGKQRDTGKIEHKAQSEDKKKYKNTTQKTKPQSCMDPTQKGGMNPGVHEGRVLFSLLYQL